MNYYTVFDLATGRIQRTFSCPPEMVELQFDANVQGCIEGAHDERSVRIVDGAPVDLPSRPSAGHVFDWTSFSWIDPQAAVTFAELQQRALDALNVAYTSATRQLSGGYPAAERESWPVQIAEARIVLNGDAGPTPWIDAAAAERGLARADLAARIDALDVAYRALHGRLSGIRQRLEREIAAATSAGQLAAITWPADPESNSHEEGM